MLEIKPFRGWRFDAEVTGSLDTVVTPPYDVIRSEERAELARNPFSFVHAILPQAEGDGNAYAAAAATLQEWEGAGALIQDEQPWLYVLRQRFTDLDGQARERKAFFAAVRLPEKGEDYILGHERTFDKPIADRLALTRAVEAHLGAVFVLYSDPEQQMAGLFQAMKEQAPEWEARTIDGVEQAWWRVEAPPSLATFFEGQRLYIADGHHRFQTACAYRDERREAGARGEAAYDFALMGFVALEDPGLAIYPPHRVVRMGGTVDWERFLANLAIPFEVTPMAPEEIGAALKEAENTAIGMCVKGDGSYLLRLREEERLGLLGTDRGPAWRDLDVAVLHRGILERILGVPEGAAFEYEKNLERAIQTVAQGEADLAFLLRPTQSAQICACAEAGEAMPQKSTYFFPKLPSGGVFYRFRD